MEEHEEHEYRNAKATKPEYLPYVLSYARTRVTLEMPSLESEYGKGYWKVDSHKKHVKRDGYLPYYVYWKVRNGRVHRIGSFESLYGPGKESKCGVGSLVVGHDELGRRLIRVSVEKGSQEHYVVAVEYECVRGEWMPKPCHDLVAQAFRA